MPEKKTTVKCQLNKRRWEYQFENNANDKSYEVDTICNYVIYEKESEDNRLLELYHLVS